MKKNIDEIEYAELLWVDKKGAFLKARLQGADTTVFRVPFDREVDDERDARSALTMMAQVAWETERSYNPSPIPQAVMATEN